MKIKIPEPRRADIVAFLSSRADTVSKHEQRLKMRRELIDLSLRANDELKAKQGLFDLNDDKEVLAHLIRAERAKLAAQRRGWEDTLESHEHNQWDELHTECSSKISGPMNDLIEATVAAIAQKLTHSVGSEEAIRLARLSQPVTDLEKLKATKFTDYNEEHCRFHAIRRMLEVFNFILGDKQDEEELKTLIARFKKAMVVHRSPLA